MERERSKRVGDTTYRLIRFNGLWAVTANGTMLGYPSQYDHALAGYTALTA